MGRILDELIVDTAIVDPKRINFQGNIAAQVSDDVDENAFDIPFRTVQAGCMLIDELDHRAGQVRMFAGENKNRQLGRGI